MSHLKNPVEGSSGGSCSLLQSELARPVVLSIDTKDIFTGHMFKQLLPCCLHAGHAYR